MGPVAEYAPVAFLGVAALVVNIVCWRDRREARRRAGLERYPWYRRCPETKDGALWLMTDAHLLDCPVCGRLLAIHRWR